MIDIKVEVRESFYKKTSHDIVKQCIANTIRNTTLEEEKRCKVASPYDTGALRRGHSSEISSEEGLIRNRMNYAVYVVHGTSKMEARNYPQEVANDLASENYMSESMEKELKKKGVIE